jgi:16S rRNA processing protein RimM
MPATAAKRIPVGYIRKPHGVRGAVVIRPLTDNPDRFSPGQVLITDETPPRLLTVAESQQHRDGVLATFVEVLDRTAAEALPGVTLAIAAADRRSLDEDEYWPDALEGLAAIDPTGKHLGRVTGVVIGTAQDRLVVTTEDGTAVEVPFVEAIVGEVHPSLGYVVIDPLEGLF